MRYFLFGLQQKQLVLIGQALWKRIDIMGLDILFYYIHSFDGSMIQFYFIVV